MFDNLKSLIPNSVKDKIIGLTGPAERSDFTGIENKPKIFVTLSGQYQNLGDVAITSAQLDMLKSAFPGYAIPEISARDTYQAKNAMKATINKGDIIIISGGGNMSDKYISLENARRYIINNFKDYKIVSFPQTLFFGENKEAQAEFIKSCNIYNSHPDLTLFARDKKSFDIMKASFTNAKVFYCPDIVLHSKKYLKNYERDGILCCLRKDSESSISDTMRNNFIKALISNFPTIFFPDTTDISLESVMPDCREKTLSDFLEKFSKSKVVVTDRLHGLIFSVITKTPCLAIPNRNQKVESLFNDEINSLPYIKLFHDGDNIIDEIKALSEIDTSDMPAYENSEAFTQLINAIKAD